MVPKRFTQPIPVRVCQHPSRHGKPLSSRFQDAGQKMIGTSTHGAHTVRVERGSYARQQLYPEYSSPSARETQRFTARTHWLPLRKFVNAQWRKIRHPFLRLKRKHGQRNWTRNDQQREKTARGPNFRGRLGDNLPSVLRV